MPYKTDRSIPLNEKAASTHDSDPGVGEASFGYVHHIKPIAYKSDADQKGKT